MPKYGASTPKPAKDAPATANLTFDLGKTVLAFLYVRFLATFTVTGGTGAGTLLNDALQRYLRKLTYQGDDRIHRGAVQTWSARSLQTLAVFLLPKPPLVTQPSTLAAGTAENVECWVPLFFNMQHSGRPDDYAAPTAFATNPQLQIETGNPGDLARGEDGVIGFTNPRIEIHETPLVDAPRVEGYGRLTAHTYTVAVTVAKDDEIELKLSRPGMAIRGILIEAEDNGTGGVGHSPSDNVITYLSLNINNHDKVEKSAWSYWQNRNVQVYNLSAKRTGAVWLDAAENGETWGGGLWGIIQGYMPTLKLSVAPGAGETQIRITVVGAIEPRF